MYFEGKIQTRKWQDQNGQDRYTTEIVVDGFSGVMQMLGGRSDGGGQRSAGGFPQDNQSGGNFDQSMDQSAQPYQQQGQQQGQQQQAPRQAPAQAATPAQTQGAQSGGFEDFDDDIPF